MVTKSRKTLLQNPLDEIPVRRKAAVKAVSPVSQSAENTKTVRAAKTAGATKTAGAAKTVRTAKTAGATKTAGVAKAVRTAKTAGATKTAGAAKTPSTPDTARSQKTDQTAPKKAVAGDNSVESTVRVTHPTSTTLTTPQALTTTATVQTPQGLPDDKPSRAQTAEQLMTEELNRSSDPVANRDEEIIKHPCTPTQVLEQPGTPGVAISGAGMTSQFLTADDVFQNELSRARVAVKAEITRTRLSAQKIVTRWSRWSVLASFIPTPFVDVAAISGVQVKMIYELCKQYEIDFEHKAALAIASGVAGGAAVQTLASLLAKQIVRITPGVGTVFIFAIEPAISYVTTQAMGLAFISHFEADGRLHDFNPEKIRQYMAAQLEKRKSIFKGNSKPQQA